MLKDLRKMRIGFVSLLMLNVFEKEAEEKAIKIDKEAVVYLEKIGAEIYKKFPVVTNLNQAKETWEYFKEKKVDAVILYNGAFSLGNLIGEIARNLDCPFMLWGLEEYLIEKRLLTGSMIGVLPGGTMFRNLDKKFSFVYGQPEDKATQEKIKVFLKVVKAIVYLRESRIGILGNRPDGFETTGFSDFAIKKIFGTTIINLSMIHFFNKVKLINDKEISEDLEKSKQLFEIEKKDFSVVKQLSRLY
jgi:L-fucose isomerase-like protein